MNKWRAECTQCPTTTDLDYGHEVPVYVEYTDESNTYAWAWMHHDVTGHAIRITKTLHMDVNMDEVDPGILNLIFGVKDE
jgi:hypothetical protein